MEHKKASSHKDTSTIKDKKSKLINLIDQEIFEAQVEIYLIQKKIDEYKSLKRINDKQEKSIQVSLGRDVGVQVDQIEFDLKESLRNHQKNCKNCHFPKTKSKTRILDQRIYMNREKQYCEKVEMLKKNDQDIENHENDRKIAVDQNQNYLHLKGAKKLSTTDAKIYRSVAVETTLCDELNLSLLDETVYLNLPNRINSKLKPKRKMKGIKEDLIPELIEEMKIDNNKTYSIPDRNPFSHSLIEISSRSSTPKKSTDKNIFFDQTLDDQPSIEIIDDANSKNDSQKNVEISLPSVEYTHLSDLSSIQVSKLDHDQFWKDVFRNAGMIKNKE